MSEFGPPCTARQLLERQHFLTTGDPRLDQALEGGIAVGGVTEIAGSSATGKTQLCLQLCLMAQLPRALGGLDGDAIYFSTEDLFPSNRLFGLAEALAQRHAGHWPPLQPPESASSSSRIPWSDRILLSHLTDVVTQDHLLTYQLPVLLARGRVKLVVIDSIAANFRSEELTALDASRRGQVRRMDFYAQRQHTLLQLSQRLRRLGEEYGVAIVCVNQVTDVVRPDGQGPPPHGGGSASLLISDPPAVKPALGMCWSQCVNTRLLLIRNPAVREAPHRINCLKVVSSPYIASKNVPYYIDATGVHGC
ncbi:DNA repair protein rhp57 [Dimargaris cristalligena]|nr:DNA repair protein rhp57 [Dimargaris cristalligena]